jgi:hypothetical protein
MGFFFFFPEIFFFFFKSYLGYFLILGHERKILQSNGKIEGNIVKSKILENITPCSVNAFAFTLFGFGFVLYTFTTCIL